MNDQAGFGFKKMKGMQGVYVVLALAAIVSTAQLAGGQNPAPAPAGQTAAEPATDPETLTVQIVNGVPPVDWGNLKEYLLDLESRTKEQWMQVLPSLAKPPLSTAGTVKIVCWVHTDGRATNMMLEQPSGKMALDRAAWAGITGSAPYAAFPYGISVDRVRVRFTFVYNQGDESAGPIVGHKGGPIQ
jgi:TonB family protein